MKISTGLDADSIIESWELQQNAHIKNRESRFKFMFEVVEQVCGNRPTILDLACGPGSLSGRFINELPEGKSVAVDYDPVLLSIARSSSKYDHDRITFFEANLASQDWTDKLPVKKFDAILSTTALHWLPEGALGRLYATIHSLLSKNGVFLNGDHIYPELESVRLKNIFRDLRHHYEEKRFESGEALNWTDWWDGLSEYPEFKELLEERKRRYPESDRHDQHTSLETHIKLLKEAGFEDVEVGWQDLDNRVLIALK